jgi:hypothetical protein
MEMQKKSDQFLSTLVNVLYWKILVERSPQPNIFVDMEAENMRGFCGTYEPWSMSMFKLACAFYVLISDLRTLLDFKGTLKSMVSREPIPQVELQYTRVSNQDCPMEQTRPRRNTLDECLEYNRECVARMLEFGEIHQDMKKWIEYIEHDPVTDKNQIANVVGSLLVLQSYQRLIPPSVAMYDFQRDESFMSAISRHLTRTYDTIESQLQYTNINAESGESGRNYLSLVVKRFDSSPPPFLDSRLYSSAHLCVAVWHPASRSWLKIRQENPHENLTSVESMYQSDEYISCISSGHDEDSRISVDPPLSSSSSYAIDSDENEVRIQAYHIFANMQSARHPNKHSFSSHRVTGFMLLDVKGSCTIQTHTLIGPIKTSFSQQILAPEVATGKEVEIAVEFHNHAVAKGAWKVAQILLMDERKKLNAYNERLFVSTMALDRREATETSGATTLAQNNPYVFLPATALSRVHTNLLTMVDVEKMIRRALRRLDMGVSSIDTYMELSTTSVWGTRRLREITHMLFVDFAMVAYDTDRINKTQLEQMMPVSVTGSGDCEDGAIAIYQILVSMRRMFSEGKRTSNKSYDRFVQYLSTEYAPAICNFRANSNSHGVAYDSPASNTVSHNAAILLPVSAAANRIALPIVLETTGVAAISPPLNVEDELSFVSNEIASAVVAHILRRKRICTKLSGLGFEGFDPIPMSPDDVDKFYDYSQYVCSTELGGFESTTLRFDYDFQAAARKSLSVQIKGALSADEPSPLIDRCAVFIPPKQMHVEDDNCKRCKDFEVAHKILSDICETAKTKNQPRRSNAPRKNVSEITPRATTFFMATCDYTVEQISDNVNGALEYLNSQNESWLLSVQHCMFSVIYIELFVDHGQH